MTLNNPDKRWVQDFGDNRWLKNDQDAFDAITPASVPGDLIVQDWGEAKALPKGRRGQVLGVDPAIPNIGIGYGEAVDPRYKSVFFDDFSTYYSLSYAGASGTGASYSGGTASGHPGGLTLTTGTTTTGGVIVGQCANNRYVNTTLQMIFETVLWVPALSTSTEEFALFAGFNDFATTISSAHPSNGIYFSYDRANDGDFWAINTANGGTRTKTVTSTAISTSGWVRLTLVNTNGVVAFQVNGNTVGQLNTNIPTNPCGFSVSYRKKAGTTSRSMYLDYLYCSEELNR